MRINSFESLLSFDEFRQQAWDSLSTTKTCRLKRSFLVVGGMTPHIAASLFPSITHKSPCVEQRNMRNLSIEFAN